MKRAVVIGAGPAGLTAAYELATRTKIKPVVIEKSSRVGGLATTIDYKGYKMDLGGHRFFTKSDRVLNWWFSFLPIDRSEEQTLTYHGRVKKLKKTAVSDSTNVMHIRNRISRIYYRKKFFGYPLKLNYETLQNIGFINSLRILTSYVHAILFPIRPEISLEDFFINRFGTRLYQTFFKTYTEKVWGQKCSDMPALWGAQRVKGLSIQKAIFEGVRSLFTSQKSFPNKDVETSLIEKFLYPTFGPGQLWNLVSATVKKSGGEIHKDASIKRITLTGNRITSATYTYADQENKDIPVDYLFSTIAIKDLVALIHPAPPKHIRDIATNLEYRDFLVVGVLLAKTKIPLPDTWIYIHDPEVAVGRVQIFNNWSPSLVVDPTKTWIGMEYFCNKGDKLWNKTDREMKKKAFSELVKIGIASQKDILDATVVRAQKAYPAYTGSYSKFDELKAYLDSIVNLYPIGRNGMHKYNNQDHSMLTAMIAVDNIVKKRWNKENIWAVNTEETYHENK